MRTSTLVTLASSLTMFLFASQAVAQGKEKPKPDTAKPTAARGFSDAERHTIADYFVHHEYDVEALPPGIVRRLEKGKPLPPGIAKRQPPPDLVALLPRREGLEVTIFGDRIVLLEASGIVVDVIEGIFR